MVNPSKTEAVFTGAQAVPSYERPSGRANQTSSGLVGRYWPQHRRTLVGWTAIIVATAALLHISGPESDNPTVDQAGGLLGFIAGMAGRRLAPSKIQWCAGIGAVIVVAGCWRLALRG